MVRWTAADSSEWWIYEFYGVYECEYIHLQWRPIFWAYIYHYMSWYTIESTQVLVAWTVDPKNDILK